MDQSDQTEPGARPARAPRQGRVGILPNPNRKPMPPPRKPPLLGRVWHLRSSRRPPLVPDPPAPPAPDPESLAAAAAVAQVVRQRNGAIAEIDIDQLNALAETLTVDRPRRRGIADHITRDSAADRSPAPDPHPPARPDPAPDPVPPAAPEAEPESARSVLARLRFYLARLARRGG